jgi:protein O-mannosyl-transferase
MQQLRCCQVRTEQLPLIVSGRLDTETPLLRGFFLFCKTTSALNGLGSFLGSYRRMALTLSSRQRTFMVYLLLMICGFWLSYHFYSLAFDAPWFFDDEGTLAGLKNVQDWHSAKIFAWGGIASELGRPLANASFLLNVGDWPQAPGAFRRVNALLHLVNGLLLAWAAFRAAELVPALRERALVFAALLASFWLVQPLLFSATLMPVQRMTILSGTFTFAGLLLYLVGRKAMTDGRWKLGLFVASLGLVVGAGVGFLAKETAALLPFFVASIEFTVFRRLANATPRTIWRLWCASFFLLPALLLLLYGATGWHGMQATYEIRNFGMIERIATEPVILWEYLRQAVIPDVAYFGPFHDDHPVYNLSSPLALAAICTWLICLAISVAIRKHTWVPLFALTWYCAGHLLESTVFPLELYFEHRNYVALVGPLAAMIGVAIQQTYGRYLVWLLLLLPTLSLWRVTSFWSNSLVAAEVMASYHPYSVRAAQHLATEYYRRGQKLKAFQVVDKAADRMPTASYFQAVRVQLSCNHEDPRLVRDSLAKAMRVSSQLDSSFAVGVALRQIKDDLERQKCPGMSFSDLLALTDALVTSPKIAANALLMHHIHHVRADVQMDLNNRPAALEELKLAYYFAKNPETAIMASALTLTLGDAKGALAFLDKSVGEMPPDVLRRGDPWRAQVLKFRQIICKDPRSACEK